VSSQGREQGHGKKESSESPAPDTEKEVNTGTIRKKKPAREGGEKKKRKATSQKGNKKERRMGVRRSRDCRRAPAGTTTGVSWSVAF